MATDSRHGATRRRDRDGADSLPPLVEAKLAAPGVGRSVVDRRRIGRALEVGDEAVLTLVAAPAGYGKTTAVRAWCASLDAARSRTCTR